MSGIFSRIAEFSVYGTLWTLALLFADRVFGRRGGVLWRYFVAGCIAIHLLIPVHVQWLQLMPSSMGQERAVQEDLMEKGEAEAITLVQEGAGDIPVSKPEKQIGKSIEKVVRQNRAGIQSLWILLQRIWLLGVFCSFFRVFLSYRMFCRQMARWELPVREEEKQILEQIKKQYGIRRRIVLKRSRAAVSPMLYGTVRPVVLLPDLEYCETEYRYIFQHELCHYRHGDIWMKYVFTACRGIYWFCPPVWRLCRYAFAQMELLCDEAVVREKGQKEKMEYGMVVFRHILRDRKWESNILTTYFYGGKECVKMRFEHIMGKTAKKVCIGAVAVAAACAVFLGGVKWGSAAKTENTKKTGQPVAEKKTAEKKILVLGSRESDYAEALLLIHVNEEAGSVTLERMPEGQEIYFMDELNRMRGMIDASEEGELLPSLKYFVYGMLHGGVEKEKRASVDLSCVLDEKKSDRLMTILEMHNNGTAKEFDRKEFIGLLTEGKMELGLSNECRVGDLTALMEKVISGELKVIFTGSWEKKLEVSGREYGYPTGVYTYPTDGNECGYPVEGNIYEMEK